MSNRAQLLKSIVKGDLNESPSLDKYLKSRGINPQFVSKDVKVAHSKSLAFLSWQRAHQNEEVQVEGMTAKHTPTAKRAHQLKKSAHYGSEIRVNGGMHGKKLHSEEVEDTITFDIPLLIRMLEYAREDAKSDMDLHKVVKKLIGIRDKGTLTMNDYTFVTKIKEEFEITEQDCKCKDEKEWEKIAQARSEIWRRKRLKIDEAKSSEMSKSARIIKSIYKKKGMKEELYDHEKEDKSVKGYGKKPKMNSAKDAFGETPKAAAVLAGGTTMTGQKRDTVEIDPLMRGKPNGRLGDQKPPKV